MVGVVVQSTFDAGPASAALGRLSAADLDALSFDIGTLMTEQTKLRVSDEKTAPDGTPWVAWSAGYAAQQQKYTARSLLVGVGEEGLLGAVQNITAGQKIEVGVHVTYGAIHQFGGETSQGHSNIPARPYLGLSSENSREIEDLVMDRLQELLQ